ncbi:MAG: HD domain-containing protein [Rickettsiales bacterium]|jgi:uncharacterized protein|nr:HD domain-containing protein [Rickettsiales bacterium]
MDKIIRQIKQEVYDLLGDRDFAHGAEHSFRVYDWAMRFADDCGADKDIVAISALLHDCDDYKLFGKDAGENLPNAKKIMETADVPLEIRPSIIKIIQNMGYSKLLKGIRPDSLEGACVSDADMIDGIGATGIFRTMFYNINKGNPVFDRNLLPQDTVNYKAYKSESKTTAVNIYFDKLLRIKNFIITDSAKREALQRHKIMYDFMKCFFTENEASEWLNILKKYKYVLANFHKF